MMRSKRVAKNSRRKIRNNFFLSPIKYVALIMAFPPAALHDLSFGPLKRAAKKRLPRPPSLFSSLHLHLSRIIIPFLLFILLHPAPAFSSHFNPPLPTPSFSLNYDSGGFYLMISTESFI